MLTHHIITIACIIYEFTYTAFSKEQNIEMKRSVVARSYHELQGWRQCESGFLQRDGTILHHDFSNGTKTCTSDKTSELCIKKVHIKLIYQIIICILVKLYQYKFSSIYIISIITYATYTISCCCPVAVDIHNIFYLNTSRFGHANQGISCLPSQRGEMGQRRR